MPLKFETEQPLIIGPYTLNFTTRECKFQGESHRLSKMELLVFSLLIQDFRSATDLARIIDREVPEIQQLIESIRNKFGNNEIIETKRLVGYRLKL